MLNVKREALDRASKALKDAMNECRDSSGLKVIAPVMDDRLVEAAILGAMMVLGAPASWFVKPDDTHFISIPREESDAA